MPTQRRRRFVYGQTAWMLLCLVVLTLLDAYSSDVFFVLTLIGFLVLIELTAPISVTPRWRHRLRWFIVLGLLLFGYLVVHRIVEILPPGVF